MNHIKLRHILFFSGFFSFLFHCDYATDEPVLIDSSTIDYSTFLVYMLFFSSIKIHVTNIKLNYDLFFWPYIQKTQTFPQCIIAHNDNVELHAAIS